MTNEDKVTRDAATLASGTIANLTNLSKYEDVDKQRELFITFCQAHAGEFDNWIQAWQAYAQTPFVYICKCFPSRYEGDKLVSSPDYAAYRMGYAGSISRSLSISDLISQIEAADPKPVVYFDDKARVDFYKSL